MDTYIFDVKKIEKLISDFYIISGVAVTVYDLNLNIITSSGYHTKFCDLIQSNPEIKSRCILSDIDHINEAKRKRSVVYYTCHAGNMEIVTPIFYEDTIIAYILIGQFHDEKGKCTDVLNLDGLEGFDHNKLLDFYNLVPIVSSSKLVSLQNILKIIIKSFWEDGLITRKRSMLSVKIEQYILENISRKIYIDELCKHFNISRNALYELFYKEFNVAINDFIITKRINCAKDYLRDSDKSIAEISNLCGFTDYNYFIRIFKSKCNTTPLKYRKSFVE